MRLPLPDLLPDEAAALPSGPAALLPAQRRRAGGASPNFDTVRHHVNAFSPVEPVVYDKPGRVALACDIHDQMSTHIVVDTCIELGKY